MNNRTPGVQRGDIPRPRNPHSLFQHSPNKRNSRWVKRVQSLLGQLYKSAVVRGEEGGVGQSILANSNAKVKSQVLHGKFRMKSEVPICLGQNFNCRLGEQSVQFGNRFLDTFTVLCFTKRRRVNCPIQFLKLKSELPFWGEGSGCFILLPTSHFFLDTVILSWEVPSGSTAFVAVTK